MELVNEFASVEVEIDNTANGIRLKITSKDSEKPIYLDPLMLYFLTLLDDKELFELIKLVITKKYVNGEPFISNEKQDTPF